MKRSVAEAIIEELEGMFIGHDEYILELLSNLKEEVHGLRQVARENSDWFDALKIDYDALEKQNAENEKIINNLYKRDCEKYKLCGICKFAKPTSLDNLRCYGRGTPYLPVERTFSCKNFGLKEINAGTWYNAPKEGKK